MPGAGRDSEPSWLFRITEALNQSVRPVLAYGFGVAVIAFTALGTLTPDAFLGIAAMVIGFFYQSRQAEKYQQRLEQQQSALVDLAQRLPPEGERPPPR
jgi:hypothetical protein